MKLETKQAFHTNHKFGSHKVNFVTHLFTALALKHDRNHMPASLRSVIKKSRIHVAQKEKQKLKESPKKKRRTTHNRFNWKSAK